MSEKNIDLNSLPKAVYDVCILAKTELPFSGKYNKHYEQGDYICAVCSNILFSSLHKFDSGSGWPSFWNIASIESVILKHDDSHNMSRIEILCKNCNSHLGHVFDDGPKPSGKRYCINSLALKFAQS